MALTMIMVNQNLPQFLFLVEQLPYDKVMSLRHVISLLCLNKWNSFYFVPNCNRNHYDKFKINRTILPAKV